MKISTISFDLDGTLSDDSFINAVWDEAIPRLYAAEHGLQFEEALRRVRAEYEKVGDRRIEWYDVKYWFKVLGLGEGWRELLDSLRWKIGVFPDVKPALARLRTRYRLIMVSNASREFLNPILEETSIGSYFSHVFSVTSDFGRVKSEEVYREVFRHINALPAEVVHVGDHPEFDFEVPRRLGVHAFLIDRKNKRNGDHTIHDLYELEERLRSLRSKV